MLPSHTETNLTRCHLGPRPKNKTKKLFKTEAIIEIEDIAVALTIKTLSVWTYVKFLPSK